MLTKNVSFFIVGQVGCTITRTLAGADVSIFCLKLDELFSRRDAPEGSAEGELFMAPSKLFFSDVIAFPQLQRRVPVIVVLKPSGITTLPNEFPNEFDQLKAGEGVFG